MSRDGPLFNDKIGKTPFNLRVRVRYRITQMFLFFCIFGDRDGDSIVVIKREKVFDFIMIRPSCLIRASFRVADGPKRPIMKSDRCTIDFYLIISG